MELNCVKKDESEQREADDERNNRYNSRRETA